MSEKILNQILDKLNNLNDRMGNLENEVSDIKANQNQTDKRLNNIEKEISNIKGTMATKEDIVALEQKMATKDDIENIFAEQQQDVLSMLKILKSQSEENNKRLIKLSKDTLFLLRKIVEHEDDISELKTVKG